MDVFHDVCALAGRHTMFDGCGLTFLSSGLYPGFCALTLILEIEVLLKIRATQTCSNFDQFVGYFNRETYPAVHIDGLTAICHRS